LLVLFYINIVYYIILLLFNQSCYFSSKQPNIDQFHATILQHHNMRLNVLNSNSVVCYRNNK